MTYRIYGGGLKSVTLGDFDTWLDAQIAANVAGDDGYAHVAWIYRCIWLRCNSLAGLPYGLFTGEGDNEDEVEEPWPLKRLFWQCEAALLTSGAFYVLKQTNRVKVKGLQWLNPRTMKVKTNSEGIQAFVQKVGAEERSFPPEQVIYGHYWNPADDLGPGVCPLDVLATEAKLAQHLNAWAAGFFERGAIPAVLLHTDATLPRGEAERIESSWARMVSGVKNAWKAVVLQGGLKPEVITPPVNTLAVPELSQLVRAQIATAFGIPQTLLEDAANFATAQEHRLSFYTETVNPEAEMIADVFNEQLFTPMALELRFRPEELDIMQADESDRAASLASLVASGLPLRLALEVLGYDLSDEQWAALDAEAAAKEDRRVEQMELQRERLAQPVAPIGNQPPGRNGGGQEEAVRAELRLWQRKASKRLRDGRGAACDFASAVLP
ncbi:MAG: phage portal protein, partial [Armatimonadetes bacterium]|nr:phage portal protein [Armatimonadota bacterium]